VANRITCQNAKFHGITANTTPRGWELDTLIGILDRLGDQEARSMLGIVTAGNGALLHLLHGSRQCLPHLERQQHSVLPTVSIQSLGDPRQQCRTVGDRRLAPEPRRTSRLLQPLLNFLRRVYVDSAKHLSGGRVDAFQHAFHMCNSHNLTLLVTSEMIVDRCRLNNTRSTTGR